MDWCLSYTHGKEQSYSKGVALVHPVYYDYPNNQESYTYRRSQYMFGDAILASPISNATLNATGNTVEHTVWLPPVKWSNWNGTWVYDGNEIIRNMYGWQDIPLFVKAGNVIPLQSNQSVVANFADPVIWTLFPAGGSVAGGAGHIVEDDGISLDYMTENGSAVTEVVYTGGPDLGSTVVVIGATRGSFVGMPGQREHIVQLRGATTFHSAPPTSVTVNGKSVPQGRGQVPGWWINDVYGLVVTEGALVVNCGVFPVSASISVSVKF